MRSTNTVPGREHYYYELLRFFQPLRFGAEWMEIVVCRQSDGLEAFSIEATDWDDAHDRAVAIIDRLDHETITGEAC